MTGVCGMGLGSYGVLWDWEMESPSFTGLGAAGSRITQFHGIGNWRGMGPGPLSPMGSGAGGGWDRPVSWDLALGGATITDLSGSPWVGGEVAQL